MFLPTGLHPDYYNETGRREDGINLIETWKSHHPTGHFVMNRTHLDSIDPSKTEYLLGLFSSSHMDFEADRTATLLQPSLAEMTEKAIRILQKSENGYFLFIEGGRIDHSHHEGGSFKALNDTLALADAVKMAVDMTDDNETLIVVSADHSHVFTFGGYAKFETSIFDVTDASNGTDGKPFLQLHYANGPGFYPHRTNTGNSNGFELPRLDLTGVDTSSPTFKQDASVPLSSETHGGEDVAIFARGPMSYLFHGVHEQNYIARVMMYASCVGRDRGPHCPASTGSTTAVARPTSDSNVNGVNSLHAVWRYSIFWFSVFSATIVACIRQMAL